jgi:type IV pilus assembly protein PilC
MRLAYVTYDRAGGEVTDVVEAVDEPDAREILSGRGLFVTNISQAESSQASERVASEKPGRGRLKHLSMFTRQFYVLVSSGTQVVPALGALERQTRDARWRRVISSVRARVEQGSSLSDAMEFHPAYFDAVYRSMVGAGEAGGVLGTMLARLADLTQKRLHVQSSIQGALAYPVLLLVVAFSVLGVMLVFVVPRFAGLFTSMGIALPPSTALLLTLGQIAQSYWWLILLFIGGIGAGLRFYLRTPRGKRIADTAILRIPRIGPILQGFHTATIVRLLGSLLDGHVPVLDALRLTKTSATNGCYLELLARAERLVGRGEPLSGVFGRTDLVSPSVHETARSGEQSGRLGEMMLNLADFLDEENEIILRSLTSILEPVILVVLGVLVGFVSISMFMPLFDLTSMTGAG